MNIIKEIYASRLDEESGMMSGLRIERELNHILNREDYGEKREQMSELFYEVSACGEEEGFCSGFRTAVAFMLECLGTM